MLSFGSCLGFFGSRLWEAPERPPACSPIIESTPVIEPHDSPSGRRGNGSSCRGPKLLGR